MKCPFKAYAQTANSVYVAKLVFFDGKTKYYSYFNVVIIGF